MRSVQACKEQEDFISSKYFGATRDQVISEVHPLLDKEAAIPKTGKGNDSRF